MAHMKPSFTCSRSKPPPARSSCYGLGRVRSTVNLDHSPPAAIHIMQTQESHKVAGDKGPNPTTGLNTPVTSPKEVSECLSSWLAYLQMLNGLCGAGSRLAHCLGALVQDTSSSSHQMASQCQAIWEELLKATAIASSAIKNHVLATLQEISTTNDVDSENQRLQDHNQQLVYGSVATFVQLHYHFCAACCEFLGAVSCAPCCAGEGGRHELDCPVGVLQHCFARLHAPPPPPPAPPGPQRRWSEAAAGEVAGGTGDGTMRRWSMPWESSREHRLHTPVKLTVPGGSRDRSRSTTPDSVWHSSLASQEELQEVIQLLSCRPGSNQLTQLYHPSQHLPGVTLTSCAYEGPAAEFGGWVDGMMHEGGGSPQQPGHRTAWHVPESQPQPWGEPASRKSSSSTDSSSGLSRSTTASEGGVEVRSHLYSMWSGNDLAFMKLPESSEPGDSYNDSK